MVKPIGGTFEDVRESLASVKDAVGQALEQGVQSVVGPQLTPQQLQAQEIQRQKQLAYTRKWLGDLQRAQEKVRAENKQKEEQRLKAQQEEKQVTEMKKEEKKKKQIPDEVRARAMAETKVGRGVGG